LLKIATCYAEEQ